MEQSGRASRALVGSLIVNAALLALLLAIRPKAHERPVAAPVLVDVIPLPPPPTLPLPLPPPLPVVAAPAKPVGSPAPRHARAALPVVEPAAADAGSGDGSGAGGSGDGSGGGGNGAGAGAPASLATLPIPIGSRDAQLPYTREALVAHVRGTVLVTVLVGDDGKVRETALVRGLGYGLDAIALALAGKLEFRPAHNALGEPTAARITWRFHFTPPPNG